MTDGFAAKCFQTVHSRHVVLSLSALRFVSCSFLFRPSLCSLIPLSPPPFVFFLQFKVLATWWKKIEPSFEMAEKQSWREGGGCFKKGRVWRGGATEHVKVCRERKWKGTVWSVRSVRFYRRRKLDEFSVRMAGGSMDARCRVVGCARQHRGRNRCGVLLCLSGHGHVCVCVCVYVCVCESAELYSQLSVPTCMCVGGCGSV